MKKTLTRRSLVIAGLALPGTTWAQPNPFGKQEKDSLNLARAAASGSVGAADKLKADANLGNRWAAMQYGWLAHTGQMPNRVGHDMATAMRAYNLACKVMGGDQIISLTGNQIAAYNAGLAYYAGHISGSPDPFASIKWFRAASGEEGGQPFYPALVYLAKIYGNGQGVPANQTESYRYWGAAAGQREPLALYSKGQMLIEGVGTAKNYFEGFSLLLRAADQWQTEAMYLIAQIYANGSFAHDRNDVEATKWIQIASTKEERYRKLADQMMSKLKPEDQKKARSGSINWMRSHMRAPEPFEYTKPINTPPPRRGV